MINTNTLEEIKKCPVNERIEIIESLLDSLKSDITNQNISKQYVPFTIKKISLGQEIHVDRDNLYSERGL
jgi:hypothetical protein